MSSERKTTGDDREYTRAEMREACRNNYNAGLLKGKESHTTDLTPLPKAREALPRELVREIAMEIGKEIASHIETMYPKAVEATSKNMLLSLRNSVHNDIMAAVDALEHGNAEAWLERRQAHRRAIRAEWRKTREGTILDGEAIYE